VTVPTDQVLLEAVAALATALQKLRAPGMIIGGMAVIARGVPRLTVDVDATVWGADIELLELFGTLAEQGIVPRVRDALEFARERQVLLLRHDPTGTPMEVSIAWLPFEREALEKATPVQFAGVDVPVALPEDLVVYKALAWRDQDRSDIERLLVLHGKSMDLEKIRALVAQFASILGEPQRVEEFEALTRRALK
jgi:hypothetical protein